MKFVFTDKKVDLPSKVHAYAEKKVSKLDRYFKADAEAAIVFSVEKGRNNAELTVRSGGTIIRVAESTSDMFATIDSAVASVERQLRKNKTRLEKRLLAQNAEHKDWCCTEELMKTTRDGKALYLHCLPADINDVSCVDGEVEASVFDRYRTPLYKEASFKPYIIAAMIFLAKCKDPQAVLKALEDRAQKRQFSL